MKTFKHGLKLFLVTGLVLAAVVFSGCAQNQATVHSSVQYRSNIAARSSEIILENNTPLAAPRVITKSNDTTIAFVCEYVKE